MVRADIIGKIFQKAVDILRGDFVQVFRCEVLCFDTAQGAVFFIKVAEEDTQVVGVCQTGLCGCGLGDAPEKDWVKGGSSF